MSEPTNPTYEGDDLAARVRAVINDCLQRRANGEAIADDLLIAEHPEFAPHLADELQKLCAIAENLDNAAQPIVTGAETISRHDSATGSGRLEVRCPSCHTPMEVAVDTLLTDLTCSSCGSHFSLVDQSQATRMAPPLTKLGRFELIERLGIGGFGSVWKARDKELDRTVAIKIPRASDMTSEQQEKFFREARAAAQLRHPSIVSVHEVGRDGDSVYIVSDFVRGVTLGDWLSDQQLTSREAAELTAKIADALHHAHEKGVVHRDLKPANIMMDCDGQPHLMDFGLARRLEGEVTLTVDGQVIGTPAYMSPEQALGEAHTADRRSDVYSLGVILFQLLTNELPFRGNARMLIKHVAYDEPPSPRDLNSKIPKDLETVTLKCLEKEPNKRYQTASDLADELHRFLGGESIDARPIGNLQHAWRWMRRRPQVVAWILNALFLLTVIPVTVGLILVLAQRNRAIAARAEAETQRGIAESQRSFAEEKRNEADDQRTKAEVNEKEAVMQKGIADQKRQEADVQRAKAEAAKKAEEYESYVAQIGLTATKINENAYDVVREILDDSQPELRNWEWGRLEYLSRLGVAKYDAAGPVAAVAYSPDGKLIATGDMAGDVTIRDAATGKILSSAKHGQYVLSVTFSPDGRYLATGSSDGKVRILDVSEDGLRKNGPLVKTIPGHEDGVLSVRFSPDGRQLLSGSYDNTARLWDVASGNMLQELKDHSWWVWAADFSPDGNRIVTASQDGTAIVWQKGSVRQQPSSDVSDNLSPQSPAPSPQPLYLQRTKFVGHNGAVYAARFSPDGKFIATGGYDKMVMIWNPNDVKPLDINARLRNEPDPKPNYLRLAGHDRPVRSVSFSPNGQLLLSCSEDNTLRIWDVVAGKSMKALRGHGQAVRSCSFSPDKKMALSGSDDMSVRVWNVAGYQEARVLSATVFAGHEDAVLSARFSTDGKKIVTASRDRTATLWDAASGQPLRRFQEGHEFLVSNAVFFPNGQNIATGAGDNSVRVWNLTAGTQELVFPATGRTGALAVSPDSKLLVTGSPENEIKVWDARTGRLVGILSGHEAELTALDFSPSGDRLASGDDRGRIRLWKVVRASSESANDGDLLDAARPDALHQSWLPDRELLGHNATITGIRFTPDGSRLIVASGDNTVGQWDLGAGEELRQLVLKHNGWVSSLDLSSDGKLALTACDDGMARVWRLADAAELASVKLPEKALNSISISPVGSSPGKAFNSVSFSPDGTSAALTSAEEKRVYLWTLQVTTEDAKLGEQSSSSSLVEFLDFNKLGEEVWSATFAADGRHLLTIGGNDAQLWNLENRRPVIRYSPHGAVASAAVSPDGKLIATGSWDHSAKIWDETTGRALRKLENGHKGYINSVEFSPDGRELLTASDDYTARLWDVASGKPTGIIFRGHEARVMAATFSPDGTRVLTVSGDKKAIIWDRATGKQLVPLTGHKWAVLSGKFSADAEGKLVITGSQDDTAIIWDSQTGQPLHTLKGHTAPVTSVAFSPDCSRALTGSQDNTAKLWDATTDKEILSLPGHTQEVTSVSFSPDGLNVLTSSRDGTAIIWLASDWRDSNAARPLRQVSPAKSNTKRLDHSTDDLFDTPPATPKQSESHSLDSQSIDDLFSPRAAARDETKSRSPKSQAGDDLFGPPAELPPSPPAEKPVAPAATNERYAQIRVEISPASIAPSPNQTSALIISAPRPAPEPPYQLEGFIQAQEYANNLKVIFARMRKDKDAEVAAYDEFKEWCRKNSEYVRQLNELGRRGGEAEKEALARFRHQQAEADLAALRGNRDLERKWLKLSMQAARDRMDSVRAAYEADKAPLDFLLQAHQDLARCEIRCAIAGVFRDQEAQQLLPPGLANDMEIKIDRLVRHRNAVLDTWRKIEALYQTSRRGGEAEKEALARVKYFEASTELGELASQYEKENQSGHTLDLSLPAGNLPKINSELSTPVLQLSESAVKAGEDAVQSVQAAYEADKAPLDLLASVIHARTEVEVAHAKRLGDRDSVINALVRDRNTQLDCWRKTHALYDMGRRGGEFDKEVYSRARYFESQARLHEAVGTDQESLRKYVDALNPPAGSLPDDWSAVQPEYKDHSLVERNYRSALHAIQELIPAWDNETHQVRLSSGFNFEVRFSSESYLELVLIAPDGREVEHNLLKDDAILNLRALFASLPDNRYRIHSVYTPTNSRRVVIDVFVRHGRIIDSSDDSDGSRDRPPMNESPQQSNPLPL